MGNIIEALKSILTSAYFEPLVGFIGMGISVIGIFGYIGKGQEENRKKASEFIKSNEDELEFLQLCPIAYAYKKNHNYSRKIYSDFCELPVAVQKQAFKDEELRFYKPRQKQFFSSCIKKLSKKVKKKNPEILPYLYDNGAFLESALARNDEEIKRVAVKPGYVDPVKENLNSLFDEIRNEKGYIRTPSEFGFIRPETSVYVCDSVQRVCSNPKSRIESKDGAPFGPETMEDLFLYTLYVIWVYIKNKQP